MSEADPGERNRITPDHAAAYAGMIAQFRILQDAMMAPGCDTETLLQVTHAMAGLVTQIGPPSEPDAAWRALMKTLPSRGRAMCPVLTISQITASSMSGTIVFGHHFLGRNGAAHGGAIAMAFDELFGSLVNSAENVRARTAFLHVDYRRITPIRRELRAEAKIQSMVGRKLQISGSISDSEGVCAAGKAMFVRLNPGQL